MQITKLGHSEDACLRAPGFIASSHRNVVDDVHRSGGVGQGFITVGERAAGSFIYLTENPTRTSLIKYRLRSAIRALAEIHIGKYLKRGADLVGLVGSLIGFGLRILAGG